MTSMAAGLGRKGNLLTGSESEGVPQYQPGVQSHGESKSDEKRVSGLKHFRHYLAIRASADSQQGLCWSKIEKYTWVAGFGVVCLRGGLKTRLLSCFWQCL